MGYDISEVYQSNSEFLKADDIGNNMWTATISGVGMKDFEDGSRKLLVSFSELDKGLVLNKTNADTIGDLHGKNTDSWIGKQVMLFTMSVDYQNKKVQAIRLRAPAQQIIPQRSQQTYQEASGGNPPAGQFAPPPSENPLGGM